MIQIENRPIFEKLNIQDESFKKQYEVYRKQLCDKYFLLSEGVDDLFVRYNYYITRPLGWKGFLWGNFEGFVLGYLTSLVECGYDIRKNPPEENNGE